MSGPIISYIFNFLIQIIFVSCFCNNFYTFLLKCIQHLNLPWKKFDFFYFYRGKACSYELCIQFFDMKNICFMLLKQLKYTLFNEMQSTFGATMEKIGLFFGYRRRPSSVWRPQKWQWEPQFPVPLNKCPSVTTLPFYVKY
jgi:hypothetical protein